MKKVFLIATISIFTLFSCTQKTKEVTTTNSEITTNSEMMENDSTMMNDGSSKKMMAEKMYACPMHPEVQGKLNDKCSKCGMPLTEEVAENAAE
jgi:hypothetical protein